MYDTTARFMAEKLKEFCEEQAHCSKCPFAYNRTLIGSNGKQVSKYFLCGLGHPDDEWIIPEEDRNEIIS